MDTTESKNPMGESKAKGGAGRVIAIAGSAFVVIFIGIVALGYLGYNALKNSSDLEDFSQDFSTGDDAIDNSALLADLRAEVEDQTLSLVTRRDAQVSLMLYEYSNVVGATASDVSWEEYIDALDTFIAELDTLYTIDPNTQLKTGVDLFHEAREMYVEAVHFDDPSAAVDSLGVEEASAKIQSGQDAVNLYLNELDSSAE